MNEEADKRMALIGVRALAVWWCVGHTLGIARFLKPLTITSRRETANSMLGVPQGMDCRVVRCPRRVVAQTRTVMI